MEKLRTIIGLADIHELMSKMFSFPDETLARGLSDGSLSEDMRSCLSDGGSSEQTITAAERALAGFLQRDPHELAATMKKEFSLLYLAPGEEVPVFPYEGPFRLKHEGRQGKPALFGSAVSLDVESCMREAGIMPKLAHKEPIDSVWNEFAFLSFLYGSLAAAVQGGDDEAEDLWRRRISVFFRDHVEKWLPAFMEQTQQAAKVAKGGATYSVLAGCGLAALEMLESDVRLIQVLH